MVTYISEKTYRLFFRWAIILKGLFALGEVALGCIFLFVSNAALYGAMVGITGDELIAQHSHGLLWGLVTRGLQGFFTTPHAVWAFIFISHGTVKLVLIVALLLEKKWAYPWGAGIFSLFIVYQLWQMLFTPSLTLLFVTFLDALVVALILHEWRWRKRHPGGWRSHTA